MESRAVFQSKTQAKNVLLNRTPDSHPEEDIGGLPKGLGPGRRQGGRVLQGMPQTGSL